MTSASDYPISWSDELSVHVAVIDVQHKQFVKILNTLYQATLSQTSDNTIPEMFQELEKYADYHFKTEEKYFKEFKYEEAEEHMKAHAGFKLKLTEFIERYDNKEEIVLELLDYIENWLVDHLMTYDKRYTKCFNDHGLK